MKCAEFQRVLPYIIDSGGNSEEEAHLKSCPVCSDLVADLKYIADQAKLLVPMEEPNPRVWSGIQSALEREGLVRSRTERFRPLTMPSRRSPWRFAAPVAALAALAVIAMALLIRTPQTTTVPTQATAQPPANAASLSEADQQVIAAVSKSHPKRAESLKRDLNDVNSYISDAKKNVDQNPDDAEARDTLVHAYQQKALLYEVATSRSLE